MSVAATEIKFVVSILTEIGGELHPYLVSYESIIRVQSLWLKIQPLVSVPST